MKTYIRYLRDDAGFPYACLAAAVDEGNEARVGWSVVHKKDRPGAENGKSYKGKAMTRRMAVDRAVKGVCHARLPDFLWSSALTFVQWLHDGGAVDVRLLGKTV